LPLPTPEPGLVLCYEFLWSHEAEAGQDQGEKKRPSVVVLATKTEKGQTSVTVAPITHTEPKTGANAIEIPAKVKEHLGLDSERSWIICDELNEFVWPGYDLYPVPKGRPGQFDYGFIPPVLYEKIRKLISELDAKAKSVVAR
jgi:hypothetical protein